MKRLVSVSVIAVLCLSPASVPVCAAEPQTAPQSSELEIRVVFDNTSARKDLRRSWGFSAVVDFGGHRILFDAGSTIEAGNSPVSVVSPVSEVV